MPSNQDEFTQLLAMLAQQNQGQQQGGGGSGIPGLDNFSSFLQSNEGQNTIASLGGDLGKANAEQTVETPDIEGGDIAGEAASKAGGFSDALGSIGSLTGFAPTPQKEGVGGRIANAGTGALTGAKLGSGGGPIGAIIGALLGGTAGAFR